jgi:hypothetical protein
VLVELVHGARQNVARVWGVCAVVLLCRCGYCFLDSLCCRLQTNPHQHHPHRKCEHTKGRAQAELIDRCHREEPKSHPKQKQKRRIERKLAPTLTGFRSTRMTVSPRMNILLMYLHTRPTM